MSHLVYIKSNGDVMTSIVFVCEINSRALDTDIYG